jgi:hypothetical protein
MSRAPSPGATSQLLAVFAVGVAGGAPIHVVVRELERRARFRDDDRRLDARLEQTFPASDPAPVP